MEDKYKEGPAPEVHYFKSPGGGLLIKTTGEDKEELELDTHNLELKFCSEALDPKYYLDEGYTTITREEFDRAYKAIVEKLNKFASL